MKRLIPLLALLLWPLAASAQIVSPGGGQMLSSATIVGGTCTNPQFVQGVSTNGTPTCATPTLGSGVPNGAPPQFVGYSATNVGEAETLGGDATFTRTGANAYSIIVTKSNGTVLSTLATASIPLAVTLGGTGTGTAPAAGQILVAQSATAFSPVTMSGDATISNAGALAVNNLHFGSTVQALTSSSTLGGLAYFGLSGLGSSALLALNMPVLGGGNASAPFTGTRSGNTTKFVTTTGTLTSGDVATWDASGNAVDGGAALPPPAAPLTNPTNGQNNYAPLASPSLTGTVTAANLTVPAAGTITFPDGSTYTSAGHNTMKALGIGVAAPTTAGQLIAGLYSGNNYTRFDLTNGTSGTTAGAAVFLNGDVHSSWILQTSSGYTASGPNVPGDALDIGANGANGMVIATNSGISPGPPIVFWSGASNVARMGTYSNNGTLWLPNGASSSIYFGGSATQPNASMASMAGGTVNLQAGSHNNGSTWIADATWNAGLNLGSNGGSPPVGSMALYFGGSNTVGAAASSTYAATWSNNGLNLLSGTLFINGANQFVASGSWTPTFGCSTTNPTMSGQGANGHWQGVGNMIFYEAYLGWSGQSGGAGNAFVGGLPFNAIEYTGSNFRGECVVSNSTPSNAGSNKLLCTVNNGQNSVQFNETNFGSFGYLIPSPCANIWPNQPSGAWLNGYYQYQ